ncbi:MAG: hypothetical protein ACLTC3_10085 [Evtepia gabavorous]
MELSSAIRRAIRRDEPVVVDGITLYPIRVAEYEEFLTARPAIEVMQRTFPVRLLSVPLLQALYTMDLEAVEAGQAPLWTVLPDTAVSCPGPSAWGGGGSGHAGEKVPCGD